MKHYIPIIMIITTLAFGCGPNVDITPTASPTASMEASPTASMEASPTASMEASPTASMEAEVAPTPSPTHCRCPNDMVCLNGECISL